MPRTTVPFARQPINDPYSVDGLVVWFDASKITGLNDGDKVSIWLNTGNSNVPATQGVTASQPVFKTNIVNNLPVVRFVGSGSTYLSATGVFPLNDSIGGGTVFVVASDTGVFGGLLSTRNGANGWVLRYNSNTSLAYFNTGQTTYTQTLNSQFNILQVRKSVLDYELGVNGVLGSVNTEAGYNNSTASGLYLGLDNVATLANPLTGDIAEVVIYNRKLTNTEQLQVSGYLGLKYGISTPAFTPIVRTIAGARTVAGARQVA